MNVDTKISSKVIALRMKKVFPDIINYYQTAFVKNRYIEESIRNLDGILFAADMEKAFDSLKHNFIFSTLTKFGFGQDFIQWVRTFLWNDSSCVMNNGVSTGYFNLERGARQGDPLSPYLFILCLETLFIQIRNDKSIQGFKFRKIEIRLTFADDVIFLVKETQSLRKILKLIKKYGIFSSLKMNVEKCEACWIGRSKGDTDKPVKCKLISLTNNTIKILGTHFSYNKLLEKKMNFWKQRWLSLAGKIQVFKSLTASKPVYIATMKSLPQDVLEELHRMQKKFLWQGKRAKIKHSTMIGSYEKGGLNDVDLESKFQFLRIIWF